MYAHELVLHVNHNIDEFAAPFSAKSLTTCSFIDAQDLGSSGQSILQTFIVASRRLLDTFLGLPVTDMLTLPPYLYGGRVVYAIVLLLKVHRAIMRSAKELYHVIKAGELHVETYLEKLVTVSKLLIANDESNALSRAFLIMPQLRDWFYLHQLKEPPSADKTNTTRDLPGQPDYDNGQNYTIPTSTVTLGGSSDAKLSDCSVIRKYSKQLDIPGSQFDELIQPAVTSCYSPTRSMGSSSEVHGPTVATDDWFWEFFNAEMFN